MPLELELELEFLFKYLKAEKECKVLSWSWIKLRVVFELLDLVHDLVELLVRWLDSVALGYWVGLC